MVEQEAGAQQLTTTSKSTDSDRPSQWDVIQSVEDTVKSLSAHSGNEFTVVATALDENPFAQDADNRERMIQGWLKAAAAKAFPDNSRAQARYRGILRTHFDSFVKARSEAGAMIDDVQDYSGEHFPANNDWEAFFITPSDEELLAIMEQEEVKNSTSFKERIRAAIEREKLKKQATADSEAIQTAAPRIDILQEVLDNPPNLAEEQDLEKIARYLYSLYTRRPLVEFAEAMKQLRGIRKTRQEDVAAIDEQLVAMLLADRDINIDRVSHVEAIANDPENNTNKPIEARVLRLKLEGLKLKRQMNENLQRQQLFETWGNIGKIAAIEPPVPLGEIQRTAA